MPPRERTTETWIVGIGTLKMPDLALTDDEADPRVVAKGEAVLLDALLKCKISAVLNCLTHKILQIAAQQSRDNATGVP
jgi:hypothetical protein